VGGIFAADSSDPRCKNTETFNATEVYSTYKKSRGFRFIMRSRSDDLGYSGVIVIREKSNLVVNNGNALSRVIEWDETTKSFLIRLLLPPCEF
jgi:hypothetical protein